MYFITLNCALMFAVYGFKEGVTAWQPVMIPTTAELQIQEGAELKLECLGKGNIQFSMQTLFQDINQSRYILNKEHPHKVTFIRRQTVKADTGWYACGKQGIDIENEEGTIDHPREGISWIYVYVNSPEPFAVMGVSEIVQVVVGHRAVIPCRPTSPGLLVILVHLDKEEVVEGVGYDPKIGFIIHDVDQDEHVGDYKCIVKEHAFDDTPQYYLEVIRDTQLLKPQINETTLSYVAWGQNLNLSCTINAPVNYLELTWTVPDSVSKERVTCNTNTSVQEWIYTAVCVVRDVQESDRGNYICTAKSQVLNQRTSSRKYVKFWNPHHVFIDMAVQGSSTIKVNESISAQWVMNIHTYPEWTKITCSKDGRVLDFQQNSGPKSKYIYLYNNESETHVFQISNVKLDDSGKYVVQVWTSANSTNTTTLELIVSAQPQAQLEKRPLFHILGKPTNFSCHATGNPLPQVTWRFREYPDYPRKEKFELKSLSNIGQVSTVTVNSFTLTSRLNILINMSGDIICRSCNKYKCTEAVDSVLISDGAGEFGIVDPGIVVEGDDVGLKCAASRYNYTDNLQWISKNSGKLILDRKRMSIRDRKTNFTAQSVLEICNVRKTDAGDYVCRGLMTNGNVTLTRYELLVHDASAPSINYTNMKESPVFLDLEDRPRRILQCIFNGKPSPKIMWYKDGKVIETSDQYLMSDENTKLYIRHFENDDGGRYSCNATNRLGTIGHAIFIRLKGKLPEQSNVTVICLICALILVIVIGITCMTIKLRREKRAELLSFKNGALDSLNPELSIDEQAELLPYDKKWEFPREQLKLGKQLGSGAFGVVMKAEARGICVEGEVTTVAVKMVRRSAEPSYMKALSSELKIMIHLGRHLNVVNLLGACTNAMFTKRELYVIVEYCRFGNLHNYLQRHRRTFIDQIDPSTQKLDPNIGKELLKHSDNANEKNRIKNGVTSDSHSTRTQSSKSHSGAALLDYRLFPDCGEVNMSSDDGILSNDSLQPGWRSNYQGDYDQEPKLKPICTKDLICWAWQVARGMEYLSRRNVLHGDLAARNILLADGNIVKICDFGLAKNMYKDNNYKKKGDGPLPIKWMAIESIRDRIFSTQSDVWSYGIVLWEFFTLARTPYPGMEAEKLYDRLIEGYRMEKPEYATEEIDTFVRRCWNENPSLRPSFPELVEEIGALLKEGVKTHYVNLNASNVDMNTVAIQNGQSDYLTMMSPSINTFQNSVSPDSSYVPMNRIRKTNDSGNLSSRLYSVVSNSERSEDNIGTNLDTADRLEPTSILEGSDKISEVKKSTDTDSVKQSTILLPSFSLNRENNLISQDVEEMKPQTNYTKESCPRIIDGQPSYVNTPQNIRDLQTNLMNNINNLGYV